MVHLHLGNDCLQLGALVWIGLLHVGCTKLHVSSCWTSVWTGPKEQTISKKYNTPKGGRGIGIGIIWSITNILVFSRVLAEVYQFLYWTFGDVCGLFLCFLLHWFALSFIYVCLLTCSTHKLTIAFIVECNEGCFYHHLPAGQRWQWRQMGQSAQWWTGRCEAANIHPVHRSQLRILLSLRQAWRER